jgi:hypothetical protein
VPKPKEDFFLRIEWPDHAKGFSRQNARILFGIDELLCGRKWQLPMQVRSLIEIVMMTNQECIALLRSFMLHSEAGDIPQCSVEIDALAGIIKISSGDIVVEDIFDYHVLFPDDQELQLIDSRVYDAGVEVLLCAMRAFSRMEMILNTLNSEHLLHMIRDLGEVAFIQADSRTIVSKRGSSGGIPEKESRHARFETRHSFNTLI